MCQAVCLLKAFHRFSHLEPENNMALLISLNLLVRKLKDKKKIWDS